MMRDAIQEYNDAQPDGARQVCDTLQGLINPTLTGAEGRIWHGHPVWFITGNPIVGYGKLKNCVRLMFWSGQSFATTGLAPTGSFKAAELRFISTAEIDARLLRTWLAEAQDIQWDYKNIVKRKGRLERLR